MKVLKIFPADKSAVMVLKALINSRYHLFKLMTEIKSENELQLSVLKKSEVTQNTENRISEINLKSAMVKNIEFQHKLLIMEIGSLTSSLKQMGGRIKWEEIPDIPDA